MLQPPQSLWWSALGDVTPRAPLEGHADVDVAVVGGGFTGLWTARELLRRDPSLRVSVLEANVCGFGASGRNGGWASALYPQSPASVVTRYGEEAYHHLRHVLQDAVAELGAAAAADGIDADVTQGGMLYAARTHAQEHRLRAEIDEARALGVGEADLAWLEPAAFDERLAITGARGGTFSPHCARLQPAKLVRGLARVVEGLGARLCEDSRVTRITPARGRRRATVVTTRGSLHADVVVRATEGYTPSLPGLRRHVAPLYSLMVATEPQPAAFWDRVGLARYETFADARQVVIYGQRTADDRLAFGGRGAPYHFGSTVEPRYDLDEGTFELLGQTLRELFPDLSGTITHRWGGPLGMPRDHSPFVTLDRTTGLGAAGGYTGDGVVLSRVCASALADLIVDPGADTVHTRMPFVQHVTRPWEFEPLRWIGINVGLSLAGAADRREATEGTLSRASSLLERLLH